MINRLRLAFSLAAALAVFATAPAQAGVLTINNVGTISDTAVLGAINTAISNVTSLYDTGNGAGDVTLNVDFSYSGASAGNLASSYQYFYGYSYSDYTSALANDANHNAGNTNLSTAVNHLVDGNSGKVAVTFGQALLLSQYGLGAPSFTANDQININSNVTNWNFAGTASSTEYDGIGAIEHELDELLGIGGGGSALGRCSSGNFFCTYTLGATDLLRYSSPHHSSTSTSGTYLSLDGGLTDVVAFNANAGGDYGDFGPNCGPTSNNSGNNQYIQNAFNCTAMVEAYTSSSPEFTALTGIGWNITSVPEPPEYLLLGIGLIGLFGGRRYLMRK